MTTDQIISIVQIAVTSVIAITAIIVTWRISKRVQPKSADDSPPPKPRKKKLLSPLERRMVRNLRSIEIGMVILAVVGTPVPYIEVGRPYWIISGITWVIAILEVVSTEYLIRRIKNFELAAMIRKGTTK